MSSVFTATCLIVIWLVLQTSAQSPHRGRGHNDDKENQIITREKPNFLSRGQNIRGILGKNIILPCKIENLGKYNIYWRQGYSVLTAGPDFIVATNKALRLIDGYNLQIINLTTQDAGTYVCQISDLGNAQLVHILEILVPPGIKSLLSNSPLVFRKGDNVSLSCEASGNPPPTIEWTRKDKIFFPNGARTIQGTIIKLYMVNRNYTGIYTCTAYNGIGNPVAIHLKLEIHYAPEIEVARSTVYVGEGYNAELECNVHAEPFPKVAWFHKGSILNMTETRIIKAKGNQHKMLIINTQKSDFGNYSCIAMNSVGKSKADIEISGKPCPATFITLSKFQANNSFNITWVIKSYSPLEEVHLVYQKLLVNETQEIPDFEIIIKKLEKREYEITEYEISHNIDNLSPESDYEAFVKSKNIFGWSEPSEKFYFHTSREDEEEATLFSSFSRSEAYMHHNKLLLIIFLTISVIFTDFDLSVC